MRKAFMHGFLDELEKLAASKTIPMGMRTWGEKSKKPRDPKNPTALQDIWGSMQRARKLRLKGKKLAKDPKSAYD